jgi:cytochrome b
MKDKRFLLWDLPTRLCHWLLVLAVGAAVLTGQLGGNLIDWHGRIGVAIAGLVVFRIVWGFLGSTYARFAQFFPTPAGIKAYLAGEWRGEGHNPLGALSVFALISLLTAQVATGLFANDDIAFTGPLYALAGAELSERLTALHHLFADGLIGIVILHVAAIIFYVRIKKQNLVKPMLLGWKEGNAGETARGGGIAAFIVAIALAAAAVYGASGAWIPAPPTPAAVETPNW